MQTVRASARYGRAIAATAELLAKLRIEFAFVGSVARSAWLGCSVEQGSVDVIALMSGEQKNQVAMMGSNRGFRVERDEIEQSEELDLVPLHFDDVRVYVLVASNALYGRIAAAALSVILSREDGEGSPAEGIPRSARDDTIRVVRAEDLALLFAVAEDRDREKLIRLPEFDRRSYNQRLVSIGLPHLVVPE